MGIVKEKNNEELHDDVKVVNEEKVVETKQAKQNKKPKKEKQPKEHKIGRKVKETTSELKKVSWPSFGEVCKRTAIVVGFVLIATAILFGIDALLQLLHKFLIGS